MIHVVLPFHLRTLARVTGDVQLAVPSPVSVNAILDALERQYPVLKGTIRESGSLKRRPLLRFFACEEDVSFEPPDAALPEAIASGKEPFFIVGAVSGG